MNHSHLVLLILTVIGAFGHAQMLQVRLIDGRNGKPVKKAYINVWVGDLQKNAQPVSLDADGSATLTLVSESDSRLQTAGKGTPLFPYADHVKVQAGFARCDALSERLPEYQVVPFSTQDWMRTGIVTRNNCGKARTQSEPGVLIIFVRPLTFWEALRE